MRDLLILLLFSVGAIACLKRPYYGALLWVWIGLMNPHRLSWSYAYSLPLAQIAVVVTLLSMVLHPREIRWPGGGPLYMLILLTLWMGVTTLAAILLEPSIERYLFILKVIFMTLVIGLVVQTREEIVGLIWVIVASMSFYGIKGGIFTVLSGGGDRVWGPPDSVIEGNNELAVALVMIVPLLFHLSRHLDIGLPAYLASEPRKQMIRVALIVAMVLCGIAALGSQSRGALLAVTAMLMSMWWRSDRKVPILAAMVLVIPIVLSMLPDSWYSRMGTIGAYEEDASAMGRINAWTMAYNIAKDRITGAGFATAAPEIYAQYAPNPSFVIVAHSIYFQVLGEHGFVGLAIYLTMWLMTYLMAGRVARQASTAAGLEWAAALAGMVKVSLLGFAVGGAFLSLAYWDMPFYLMVVVVVLHAHVKSVGSRFPVGRLAANVG
jgi:probable O-glycosylation ligase (exosortase A-associated)